ncbi:MAG: hypothetical protein J5862_01870 [Bacteroidales bacterium]|nr:hypothetical protein [Bacteroidales bacterium]
MSSKSNGGDWIDKLQQHNRNVALQQQADAAKARARAEQEKARQAKLDREANDRHRAKLEAIARQNAAIEAQRLKILQQEKEAQELSKQQSLRLYDISCMINQLEHIEKPLAKIQAYYKLQKDFDNIVLDVITDLQYRKLYSETHDSLQRYMSKFMHDNIRELNLLNKYHELEHQIEPYIDDLKINSLNGLCQAKHLLNELKVFSVETTELTIDDEEIEFVQKSIDAFVQSITEIKGLWYALTQKGKIKDAGIFHFLLCDFFKIEDDILSSKMWLCLHPIPPSEDVTHRFCGFCYEAWVRDSSLTDTVFQIFESVENPQTVPAILMAKKRVCAKLANLLNKRNRKIEQKIIDKYNSNIMSAGAIICLSVIIGFFFPPAFFGIIPSVIIIITGEKEKERLKAMPMAELNYFLQSAKKTQINSMKINRGS